MAEVDFEIEIIWTSEFVWDHFGKFEYLFAIKSG